MDATAKKVQEEGVSIRKASKQFNVSNETLRRGGKNAPNPLRVGSGRFTSALTESEEEMIVIALEESATSFPYTVGRKKQ